jgi:hypothetical protein
MNSFSIFSRVRFLDFKHLLLVDLSSSGISFYLVKDVRDLSSIDFSNLTLLKSVSNADICKINFLSNEKVLKKILDLNLKSFDLEQYALVFLLTPNSSELEKKAIEQAVPFLKKTFFVDRHFFYNFYLMQKRNFSKAKLLISLFDDCAELSFFNQEKLLTYEKIFLRNLALDSKNFLKKAKEKFEFEQPDCFYFFTNNLIDKPKATDLAKYLKLEAIEVKNLC